MTRGQVPVPEDPKQTPPLEETAGDDRGEGLPISDRTPPDQGASGPTDESQEEYRDQLLRVSAEFANYRRRTMKERIEWELRAKADLVSRLVPLLDDIDRARAHLDRDTASKEVEGLLLVFARLEELLRNAGLEIQATEPGMQFDPEIHEALVSTHSDDYPEGSILETLQPGYLFQGVLLRPARVRVSRGAAGDAA